jgi:hypothetical protein
MMTANASTTASRSPIRSRESTATDSSSLPDQLDNMDTLMLFWLGLLLLILSILPATATDAETAQRRAFADAERALDAADRETFERLAAQLEDYALLPYLRAADLMQRLANASEQEVRRFLHRYRGTAPGERLRLNWLKHLAKRGPLAGLCRRSMSTMVPRPAQCLYRRRALHRNWSQCDAAFDGLDALYLTRGVAAGRLRSAVRGSGSQSGRPEQRTWFGSVSIWRSQRNNTGVARFQSAISARPGTDSSWLEQLLLIHAKPAGTDQ